MAIQTTLDILQKAAKETRLPHACILYGSGIVELEKTALSLSAQLLNSSSDAINRHPDLFLLRPSNKMRQINAEKVRALTKSVYQTANQGGRKVVCIYEADRMNITAANAFLKTLEEPPEDTNIILLTTHLYQLLPTIQSRCIKFNLSSTAETLNEPAWKQWLHCYSQWLEEVMDDRPPSKKSASLIIGIYGLVSQFSGILKDLAKEGWNAHKTSLPEGIDDDQLIALETGFHKGLRRRLWEEMELATREYAIQHDIAKLSQKLINVVHELEHASRLLDVNIQENTALEGFFLKSLRIWIR